MIYITLSENNKVHDFVIDYETHPLTKDRTIEDLKSKGYFINKPEAPEMNDDEIAYMYYYPKKDKIEFEIKNKEQR